MNRPIRQGDVLLVPADVQTPSDTAAAPQVVLAEGEVTGHAHRLSAPAGVLDWNVGDARYVRVLGTERGTLGHEDHDPIPAAVVAPGQTYRVIPQREWDLSGQWRKVAD